MSAGLGELARNISREPLTEGELERLLHLWEDLLTLVVDPDSEKVRDREGTKRLLAHLLDSSGIARERFWAMTSGQRSRLFLSLYSRTSRSIPQLELSSFDLDKLVKERWRHEPLTLGAAWHYGLWRSYFSHAAITHPANDGLREEFSTAWDILRKQPAVLWYEPDGRKLAPVQSIRLALPVLVGPLPHSDGRTLETAYLRAIEAASPSVDVKTSTLVVARAGDIERYLDAYRPHATHLLPRFGANAVEQLWSGEETESWKELLAGVRILELEWHPEIESTARRILERWPHLQLSVYLRYGENFWTALEQCVALPGVSMVQVHSGSEKSYRLIPQVDRHLKKKLMRARVQLVSVGGDSDTIASAAAVYEAILLGANAGAMTDVATLAIVPELIDAYHGTNPAPCIETLVDRDSDDLLDQAVHTLECWQHSILDFLSCMGIDDVQKTSGNQMAITMTEDWARECDALLTEDFALQNRALNETRLGRERVPSEIRERFRVSSLMREVEPEPTPILAGKIQGHRTVNWHLENLNRSLTGDYLEMLYRMAAGQLPHAEDFFLQGDMGPISLDGVRLKVSIESVEWSLERLERDPTALDYIQLAVPRGFERPGSVPPRARCELRREGASSGEPLAQWTADARGGFEVRLRDARSVDVALVGNTPVEVHVRTREGEKPWPIALEYDGHEAAGETVARASKDGRILLKRHPGGGYLLTGLGVRSLIWQSPVTHASISLGAASEDFLKARVEGSAGLSMVSSGEGGPLRFADDAIMEWESLQAASGHFGIHASDLRRVRDVEIKINQGAKPGKGGRLAGAKVTRQVSEARNIPVGTDALSPDPKHDIYSIEDMPAEVWLWLLYHTYCGIKISGSNYTKYVAAGMWSNFIVDYLLVDSGLAGSGNYHADSSHVGWPDIFRTIVHTHHALMNEKVDLDGSGRLRPIRDNNGVAFGAAGGTRLLASGGIRDAADMLKVLCAGADGVVVASIDKAIGFGCNQCGNCHLDCPRGGITTKPELTGQNDLTVMTRRIRNWNALNMIKMAVLIDAMNRERGAIGADGVVVDSKELLHDVRALRGRIDLLELTNLPPVESETPVAEEEALETVAAGPQELDSCRVASLAITEPVDVHAIWEAARVSQHGGNNRGGGIDFAGFAPATLAEKTCLVVNTIGPDRDETIQNILDHLAGCRIYDAEGKTLEMDAVRGRIGELRVPVRERYSGEDGWRGAGLREDVGDFYLLFVDVLPDVLGRYARTLLESEHWLQRQTRFGDRTDDELLDAAYRIEAGGLPVDEREAEFVRAIREEYFSVLSHVIDTRYYRTHGKEDAPPAKYAEKRSGYLVSMGEDLAAIKISGWTHVIPEYFELDRFWANYPGVPEEGVEMAFRDGPRRTHSLHARVWGMHHRYPTNSPATDSEGRGNPAGAHPFKSYNLLLMHNGEQVGVDSTAPFLAEYGYVHADPSLGPDAQHYHGDSVYERKALTDTEYAAYLVDFTRRVLGLNTEEATQIISPITGIDLAAMPEDRRRLYRALAMNYVQLTPTGPYKFTIVESRPGAGGTRSVGFRENMDIKFLRPHEIVLQADTAEGGVQLAANGSESRIADAVIRILREQEVIADAGSDKRINMRPGGRLGEREFGGVFEAFLDGTGTTMSLHNRFGESIEIERAGAKPRAYTAVDALAPRSDHEGWYASVRQGLSDAAEVVRQEARHASEQGRRLYGPESVLPNPAADLIERTLAQLRDLDVDDYRHLVEKALPGFAVTGDAERELALRVLTELRKRLLFTDLGGKSLSTLEYLTDGGRRADGSPEGGIFRLLDAVPALHEFYGRSRYLRIDYETRDDLVEPASPLEDVLVIGFRGFASEGFDNRCASRFLSDAVRAGWRRIVGYDFVSGPRYMGTNLSWPGGEPARGVEIELYGREHGDFLGALLEGARIYVYGQAQSHAGMKADSGRLFVLQDSLNTCGYSAHGFTFSTWDSGSRFAVAGQNKVFLADGLSPAQGFKSIHFGSPNEYAFEYLMSGGENSCHVVMGLAKPDARGELSLRPRPYSGKFFMSGAAAGRVFVFDPERQLEEAQYEGNLAKRVKPAEWERDLMPLINAEAWLRGAPIRAEKDGIAIRLKGENRKWSYEDAFLKLVPIKVPEKLYREGVPPPGQVQMVGD